MSSECPICLEAIDMSKNGVKTECGHVFHSSCLFNNIAHNGFGCPYCRKVLANEPADDDDMSEYSYVDELYSDYSLTSLRLFHQRLNGEELETTPDEEEEYESEPMYNSDNISIGLQQMGVTFEDLVGTLLYMTLKHELPEYDYYCDTAWHTQGKIIGTINKMKRNREIIERNDQENELRQLGFIEN